MTVSAITPEGMQLSIPEADNAINSAEAFNGTQIFVTLPTGALPSYVLRLTLTDPIGAVTTSSITFNTSQVAAGTATFALTSANIAKTGNYTVSVAMFSGSVQIGSAASMTFEVDRIFPNSTTITSYYSNVRGHIRSDATTQDTRPGFFIGIGRTLLDTYSLTVNSVATPATYDPVTGTIRPDAPLAIGGPYTVNARATDPAGNVSSAASFSITIVSPGMTDLTKVIKGVDVSSTDFVFDGVAKQIYVNTGPTSSVGLALAQNKQMTVDDNVGGATIATASYQWFKRTVTGPITFSFTGGTTGGKVTNIVMEITNGGTNVTWPGSVTWSAGSAPTLKTSGTDYLRFFSTNGTSWIGVVGL